MIVGMIQIVGVRTTDMAEIGFPYGPGVVLQLEQYGSRVPPYITSPLLTRPLDASSVRRASGYLHDLTHEASYIWGISRKEILISILYPEWHWSRWMTDPLFHPEDRLPKLYNLYNQLWNEVVFEELKEIIPGFNEQAFKGLKAARIISS